MTTELTRLGERHPGLELHAVEDYVDPRLALVDLSEHAYLLVVGSHGRGPVAGSLLGSVSVAVARRSLCPTVVVRSASAHVADEATDGVTVVVDRDHPATAAVELAFHQASVTRRPLRVVLCHDDRRHRAADPSPDQLRLELSELCAGLGEKFPDVAVAAEVRHGQVEDVAVAAATRSDLTVVGRQAHHGPVDLVRHHTTTTVLEHARGTVVVVPEEDR